MKKKAYTQQEHQQEQPKQQNSAEYPDRRGADRRKCKCDGYTYIPMVGWYCRREEKRRGDDDLK